MSDSPIKKHKCDADEDKAVSVGDTVDTTAAGPSNQPLPVVNVKIPFIFKLTIDCCDEIFEYLALEDLCSLGQTCKAMQKVVGLYFERNYKGAEKFIEDDGIHTVYSMSQGEKRINTSIFNEFTEFASYYNEEKKPLNYFKSHIDEFTSIKHLYFVCTAMNTKKMEYFSKLLEKIEILQIRQCTWRESADVHEIVLKYCKNLKRLHIKDDMGCIAYNRGTWLQRNYPKLEHLELTLHNKFIFNELKPFFELNPNIQSFATSCHCIWMTRNMLLKLKTQLHSLEIKKFDYEFYGSDEEHGKPVFRLLNQLFEHGFYKQLHFYVPKLDYKLSDQLVALNGLTKLTIEQFTKCCDLRQLRKLKELNILDCSKVTQLAMLANNLVSLERLYLQNATYNDILPFIRHSTNLKHFKVPSLTQPNSMEMLSI